MVAALLTLIFLAIPALAGHPESGGSFDFELSTGYRSAELRWSIAGEQSGENPNIRSELTWSDLQVFQIEGRATIKIEPFTLHAVLGYGWVLAGDTQDSDYNSDDRTDEFSRSYSDAKGGYLFHVDVAVGYPFTFRSETGVLALIPLVGIAYHRQAMVMTDGVQVISTSPPPPLGPISGLNSTYSTNWLGMWLGVDLNSTLAGRISAGAAFSVYPALYYATADWNLRTDYAHPVSFGHQTMGLGLRGELSFGIVLGRRWVLESQAGLDYWFGGPGTADIYPAAGGLVSTQLNEVIWHSAELSLSLVGHL